MTKAVDGLTFPMSRVSESASRLKTIISDMLPRFTDDYSDDLSEYVTVLVCNGKSQRQASEDLEAFLKEQSWKFVVWFDICIPSLLA
jgi:type IV pilus biogenesis protein CpaD/CtpE